MHDCLTVRTVVTVITVMTVSITLYIQVDCCTGHLAGAQVGQQSSCRKLDYKEIKLLESLVHWTEENHKKKYIMKTLSVAS